MLSLPRLPAHWAGCWGPPPTCCGRGCLGVGAQHCPLGLHALWGLGAAGVVGGPSPGGVACHRCEGRLVSGAVPPPAARPLERAARVQRPVCSGCSRYGAWGPSTGPTACALARRRCSLWGWRKGVTRGVALHHCEGRLSSGAVPLPTACPLGGLSESATHVLWARVCGYGGLTLSPWPACPVEAACRGGGGKPSRGGWPATVVRGVWCQGLSLPRPPVIWSGQPGFCDPFVPGAVGAGVGTLHQPHSVRPCGPALLAVGVAEGRPRGGCLPPLSGASEVRRCPPPDCPPTGWAVGVRHPRAVGAGVWVWGSNTVPLACMPCGGCVPRGWLGGRPRGGWPATVVRGVWCQALSLPRPPVLWSGQPGFRDPCVPSAVGAGVGTQYEPHSVRPCGPALLAVGVAEGRPRGGCLPPL